MTQSPPVVTAHFLDEVSTTFNSSINSTSLLTIQWKNKWNTFCSYETDIICADVPLYKCPTCRHYSFWLFFALILLLGLWILISNSFVIAWIVQGIKRRKTSLDYFKASLAITDLLTGVMLLCVPLPNIVWTLQLTSKELYIEIRKKANTPTAVFVSFLFMLLLTSTVFHLVLMSYNRFAAITWRSSKQTPSHLKKKLIAVWVLAFVTASYPAWFPESFNFYYIYFTFTYLPNISLHSVNQFIQAFGLFTIMLIPFLVMTILTIATAVQIRRANCRLQEKYETEISDRSKKRERAAHKTLIQMELGFTITLLPALIGLALTYTGHGHSILYIFIVYSSHCNSAINVLIYRTRDLEFQQFIKAFFKNSKKALNSTFHRDTEVTAAL